MYLRVATALNIHKFIYVKWSTLFHAGFRDGRRRFRRTTSIWTNAFLRQDCNKNIFLDNKWTKVGQYKYRYIQHNLTLNRDSWLSRIRFKLVSKKPLFRSFENQILGQVLSKGLQTLPYWVVTNKTLRGNCPKHRDNTTNAVIIP